MGKVKLLIFNNRKGKNELLPHENYRRYCRTTATKMLITIKKD
jgi:hypothetical protein